MTVVAAAMMVMGWFQGQAIAQIKIQAPKFSPPSDLNSTNLNSASTNKPLGKLFQPLPPLSQAPPPIDWGSTNFNSGPQMAPWGGFSEPPRHLLEIPDRNWPSGEIPPGVYETRPYAGIVIVPGRQHDDVSVLGPGNIQEGSKMPVINPNVQTVPLPPPTPKW